MTTGRIRRVAILKSTNRVKQDDARRATIMHPSTLFWNRTHTDTIQPGKTEP